MRHQVGMVVVEQALEKEVSIGEAELPVFFRVYEP
jgi:hypothetical protein